MEAARSSEMLVSYCSTTWHHNPKHCDLNNHPCIPNDAKITSKDDIMLKMTNKSILIYFYKKNSQL
jgi:hypothetical protein